MRRNIHKLDSAIRVITGIVLFALMAGIDDEIFLGIMFGMIGLYLCLTAALGICPLYFVTGINTNARNSRFH